jgi:hypothetical protein
MHDHRLKRHRSFGQQASGEVLRTAYFEWLELEANCESCALEVSPDEISMRQSLVHQKADLAYAGKGFLEQSQPLASDLGAVLKGHPGDVRTRTRKTRHETGPHRITRDGHHDRDG